MKIAVMQPYIFPYIGYFQMINAVDKFVFYDDVNFIKQGWINRNKILINKKDFLFTIPLHKQNSFEWIRNTYINQKLYDSWCKKFLQTLEQNYKKAPYFDDVFSLIYEIITLENETISELAISSIQKTTQYLDLKIAFKISSEDYNNTAMGRQERLIDICKQENANHYINALGGQELYSKKDFQKEGIQLSFIQSESIAYKQFNNEFVPWLSIIDVLMFNSKKETLGLLNNYKLI